MHFVVILFRITAFPLFTFQTSSASRLAPLKGQLVYYITIELICQELFLFFLKFFSTNVFSMIFCPFLEQLDYYNTYSFLCQPLFAIFFKKFLDNNILYFQLSIGNYFYICILLLQTPRIPLYNI